jgi:hypothetical protein
VKKAKGLPAVVLAVCCLGSSPPPGGKAAPFLPDGYEKIQVARLHYTQRYHEGIRITGTTAYVSRVKAALETIEAADPRSWYFVRKHVRKITLTGHSGMDVGGGRLTSGDLAGEGVDAAAGGIVHEAWHRELYERGRAWAGREAEIFCLNRQNEFLARLNAAQLDIDETLRSEYWKTDYWSREW